MINTTQATEDDTEDIINLYVRTVVFVSLAVACLICNILALLIIVFRKSRRPSARFTSVLCLENLLLGGCMLILYAAMTVDDSWLSNGVGWCRTISILFIIHILASSWTALLISIDRFIAIRRSLHYSKWVTHKSCTLLITGTVVTVCSVSMLQLINWSSGDSYQPNLSSIRGTGCNISSHFNTTYLFVIICLAFVFPFILNCFIYWTIYSATKHTTALARRNSLQPTNHESMDKLAERESNEPLTQTRRASLRKLSGQLMVHKDNRKAAKMGILVVIIQLVSCLPFCVVTSLQVFDVFHVSCFVEWAAIACLFVECIANPSVYILRNRSSQVILKSVCCKKAPEILHKVNDKTSHSQMSILFRLITSHTTNTTSDDSGQ